MSLVRYRCTHTSCHLQSFVECRVVSHCFQIGSAQRKLPLLVVLGVVDGVVLGVVLGVVDGVVLGVVDEVVGEVPRRVVLFVVTLFGGAVHVEWTRASGNFDSDTADFAVMSEFTNSNTTTARTTRPSPHELSDTPHPVAKVIV